MIGVKPFDVNKTKILVLDSKKPLGIGLTKILKENQIKYARVKSDIHFGDVILIYNIFAAFDFDYVFDFSTNDFYRNYCNMIEQSGKSFLIKISENQSQFQIKQNDCRKRVITFEIPPTVGFFIPEPKDEEKDFIVYGIGQNEYQMISKNANNENVEIKKINDRGKKNFLKLYLDQKITKGNGKENIFIFANDAIDMILSALKKFDIFDLQNIDINKRNNKIDFTDLIKSKGLKIYSNAQKYIHKYENQNSLFVSKKLLDFDKFLQDDQSYATIIYTLNHNEVNIQRTTYVLNFIQKHFANSIYFPVEFIYVTFFNCSNITQLLFRKRFNLIKNLRVIKVSEEYIRHLQNDLNYGNHHPEFIFKNIGIRRAKGKYIMTMNSDAFLSYQYFKMCNMHSFSKLSYFRSHRIQTLAEDLNKQHFLQNYFHGAEIYTYFVNLHLKNFRLFENPDLVYLSCGDFQGCHKKHWYEIQGFKEGKEVFNVDSLMATDILALPHPMVIKQMKGHIHIKHVYVSHFTPNFPIREYAKADKLMNGVLSYIKYPRKNWGDPDYQFEEF